MKRTIGALALVLFASCGIAFAADTASIVYIEGDVTMNGSPAEVGDVVLPGALMETGKASVCQVVFNTKNIVHMAAGTTLRFDGKVLSRGATVQRGAVGMVLRKLASNPGDQVKFSITTPTAVAGVRGTCFFIVVEDDDHTYVCACNGQIRLEGTERSFTQNLAASHHQELRVTRSASGISVGAAPLEYHTDEAIEAVAARIGETIDWTKLER